MAKRSGYPACVRIDPDNLPTDIPLLHRLIRDLLEVYRQQGTELTKVKQHLDQLLRRAYGRRSERLDPEQLKLFAEALMASADGEPQQAAATQPAIEQPEPSADQKPAAVKKKPKGHGRNGLPDGLPRDEVILDVEPEQKVCHCGNEREVIGEEVSEQLEYVPAMFRVVRRVRPKRACSRCRDAVVVAPMPAMPIEKGLATARTLAYVVVSKFADHLPLNRLSGIFLRHGVRIATSTLGGWMAAVASLLLPIVLAMRRSVLEGRKLHLDATPVPVLDKQRNKTRQGQLWVIVGDDAHPYSVFEYSPTKETGSIIKLLAGYHGYIHADAAPGHNALFTPGEAVEVGCRMHARRKFYETLLSGGTAALVPLAYIRQLYEVEKEARLEGLDEQGLQALRQERALPILADLNAWMDAEIPRTLPESDLGRALAYSKNHRAALDRYVEHGFLDIDNGIAERELRRVAVGRANWLFAGSDEGGRDAAILYSLVASCVRNGVEPWAYIADVLERVSTHPANRIDELLPDRWKTLYGPKPAETASTSSQPVASTSAASPAPASPAASQRCS